MFLTSCLAFVASYTLALPGVLASPFIVPQVRDDNDGVHLAVSPKCGPLGGTLADVNAGIDLSQIKTIVSFGVGVFLVLYHCLS